MVIEFETEEQFARLLEALAHELVNANIHWKLYKNLRDNVELFDREFVQSPAFWSLTFQAHIDATLFRLIRIYDENKKSLSLRNLLDTISANLHVFDEKRFRERLKHNPYVDSLVRDARRPDQKQLFEDMQFVNGDHNQLVKNLTVLRNKLFAHRDFENEVEGRFIFADYPLSEDEIEHLASTGMDILNRYVSLFRASSYSTKIVGEDDYQFILKSIRVHLEELDRELVEERVVYETLKKEL